MPTVEKNSLKHITAKPTAATPAENTQDKKNADNTTTNTTPETKKEYTKNTQAHAP